MEKLYKGVDDAEKQLSGEWVFSLETILGIREGNKEMVWEMEGTLRSVSR